LAQFAARVGAPASVLELGSLEGGHSFALAKRGYTVTAVEGREENLARARYVQRLLDLPVRFLHADIERNRLVEFGSFDTVFCVGLLYHLPEPWRLLDELPALAPRLFLNTHYARRAETEQAGLAGCWYHEFGLPDPLSGLSARSFWLTLPSLLRRLEQAGFDEIELVDLPSNPNGPMVTLAASTAGQPGVNMASKRDRE
jgi:SAM-dependent methyltransferase